MARNKWAFGAEKRKAYLAALANGSRRGAAAESIGSNRETIRRHYHKHPEFLAEIELAELDACDQVEDALFQAAISGNVVACQVWLYNRAADRWKDKRNVAVAMSGGVGLALIDERIGRAVLDDPELARIATEYSKRLGELEDVDAGRAGATEQSTLPSPATYRPA